MTVTDKPTEHDTNADLRRLLDAGYEVTFKRPPAGLGYPDAGCYWVEMTSPHGSHWRTTGETPGDALRDIWPLGDGPHRSGCGHCDNWGCTRPDCATCAAWMPDGRAVPGSCGVCGYTGPDVIGDDGQDDEPDADAGNELDPYCSTCGGQLGIFYGFGEDWHHWRPTPDGSVELVAAGHAPAVAWRSAADQ